MSTNYPPGVTGSEPEIAGHPREALDEWAWDEVLTERDRQEAKWGDQSGNELTTWVTILTEEVGELAEAVLKLRWLTPEDVLNNARTLGIDVTDADLPLGKVLTEALQCAAVAVAIMQAIKVRTAGLAGGATGGVEDA